MRLALRILLCMTCLAVELPAQDGDRRRGFGRHRERDTSTVLLKNVTYQRIEFETKSLTSGHAFAGVYLPLGYGEVANAERKYPWAIWLHGMNEDDRDFHFGGASVLDEGFATGKWAPFVLIAAAVPSRTLYANGESEGNISDLILVDLVAQVQAKFRLSAERQDRALMGVSLG